MRFWSAAALTERGTISYSLPLSGDEPSLTLSWEDGIGQGGAVTIRTEQIPYPLPVGRGRTLRPCRDLPFLEARAHRGNNLFPVRR